MYCVMCLDKPDSLTLRQENRQAHLDYVHGLDYVQVGGPLMAEDGETMIGSLLLLNVETAAKARQFVDGDPYHQAGLFEAVTIHRFNHVLGGLPHPNTTGPNN